MSRTVTATNDRAGLRTRVEAGSHTYVADDPVPPGGSDEGRPTPFDLLLAALGPCTSTTVRFHAGRKGWPLDSVTTRLERRPAKRGQAEQRSGKDLLVRELALTGPLSDEQRARLLEIAERCPVHRTLEAGARITATLEAAERAAMSSR